MVLKIYGFRCTSGKLMVSGVPTTADDSLNIFLLFFLEKIRFDSSCE